MTKHAIEEQPVINKLREEYFNHLPEIRRVMEYLETEVRYHTRHVLRGLEKHEQLVIKSRIKDCESAIQSLRRRQEGGIFDPEKLDSYSLLKLPDLAGVRVLVFPCSILTEVDRALNTYFVDWIHDPVPVGQGAMLAPKYRGKCEDVSRSINAEYQIVPMLIGLFWQVEHAAIYKPPPALKGKADSAPMEKMRADIECALLNFEAEYESFVRGDSPRSSDVE
jgi:hypothetical protein